MLSDGSSNKRIWQCNNRDQTRLRDLRGVGGTTQEAQLCTGVCAGGGGGGQGGE